MWITDNMWALQILLIVSAIVIAVYFAFYYGGTKEKALNLPIIKKLRKQKTPPKKPRSK